MDQFNHTRSPFEKQLTQSAIRLREKQNQQLALRKCPRHNQSSTTWIASIAAACVGWFFGICFPIEKDLAPTNLAVYPQPDTIIQYKEKLIRDTIIQEVKIPVKVEVPSAQEKSTKYYADIQGCNVECDGINYAMLVGM